jgi:Nif-specific regulatory protein
MARLVIVQGDGRGSIYEIDGEATIGRSPSNAIQISGTQISRVHARLLPRDGGYLLRDEGSRNGTFVNGERVQERSLARGDALQIGNVVLVYDPAFDVRPAAEGDANIVVTDGDPTATVLIQKAVPAEGGGTAEAIIPSGPSAVDILTRRLKAVYEVTRVLTSTPEPGDLMRRLIELLIEVFDADRGALLLAPAPGGELKPEVVVRRRGTQAHIAISRAVLAEVQARRQAVLSANTETDPRFDGSKSLALDTVKSFLCAPLLGQSRFLGVIYIDTQRPVAAFTEDDLHLLVHVAAQASGALANAAGFARAREENAALRQRIQEDLTLVGDSPRMRQVLERIRRVAETDSTVLIAGETGTGKDLAARAIHFASARRARPFLPVDCSAMSEPLLESELFGHEKGAFTGADQMKPGKFELAGSGTLFLDEVGNMSLVTQSKLLRVLEERKYTRVGGVRVLSADARIVAATNCDLNEAVRRGAFRQDLYFRLAVVPLELPPLRERREDIPLLAQHFLDRFAAGLGAGPRDLSDAALKALAAHAWPGNVRELRNVIERAVVLSDRRRLEPDDILIPGPAGPAGAAGRAPEDPAGGADRLALPDQIRRLEIDLIRRALDRAGGNKSEAARLLRISRPTLDKKIRDHQIAL